MKLKFSQGYSAETGQTILYVYGEVASGVTQAEALAALRGEIGDKIIIEYDRGHYHLLGWKSSEEMVFIVSMNIMHFVLLSVQGNSVNRMKRAVQDLFGRCGWSASEKVFPKNLIQPVESILERIEAASNN